MGCEICLPATDAPPVLTEAFSERPKPQNALHSWLHLPWELQSFVK